MASILKKQQEEDQYTNIQQQGLGNGVRTQQQNPNAYSGQQNANNNTQGQNGNYPNIKGQGPAYPQNKPLTGAEQSFQYLQNQKPQGYNSKYGSRLDAILEEITNPKEFKWSFNGDALFKEAADRFSQDAKLASMNAMGNAAALTGGYGNSYAQQVGQQAYDEKMRGLYDMGMDLRDRAYQMYMDDLNNRQNAYGALADADEREYGRFADQRNFDRNAMESDRAFYRNAMESDRAFYENVRQFDESLDWDKMSSDQKYAAEYAMMILQNGQMPSAEMLMAAGLSEEDAMKLMAQIQTGGGYTPKPKDNGDSEDKEPMSFYDYNVEVLKNTPMDVPLNQYGLSDTRTLGEIKAETDKKEEEKKKKAEANKTGGNWYLPESTKNKVSNLLKKK